MEDACPDDAGGQGGKFIIRASGECVDSSAWPGARTLWFGKHPAGFPKLTLISVLRIIGRAVGAWRSLVAHLLWEQGVGGSNPLAPTIGQCACSSSG